MKENIHLELMDSLVNFINTSGKNWKINIIHVLQIRMKKSLCHILNGP